MMVLILTARNGVIDCTHSDKFFNGALQCLEVLLEEATAWMRLSVICEF